MNFFSRNGFFFVFFFLSNSFCVCVSCAPSHVLSAVVWVVIYDPIRFRRQNARECLDRFHRLRLNSQILTISGILNRRYKIWMCTVGCVPVKHIFESVHLIANFKLIIYINTNSNVVNNKYMLCYQFSFEFP